MSAPTTGQPGYHQPPKRKSFWSSTGGILLIVFGSLGLLAIVGCVGLAALGVGGSRSAAAKMDVQMTSCTLSGSATLPAVTVGLSVTNNGSTTRTAAVKIEYRDTAGARLDTDTAYVRNVAPGDTARTEEVTLLDAAPSDDVACKIVGVS